MRGRRRASVLALATGLAAIGSPAVGQTTGTLALSASRIEYDGFLVSGAAVFAPALQFDSRQFSIAAQGALTAFESGNAVLQGNVAAAWRTSPARWWRFEVSTAAGAARYASEPSTGHLLSAARLHAAGERVGGWVGVSTGRSFGGVSRSPLELSATAWTAQRGFALLGSVAATWLGSDRYVDLAGAARWTGGPVALEGRLGARTLARSPGNLGDPVGGGYGEAIASLSLGSRTDLTVSGGQYLADPVRRALGARYLTGGLTIRALGPGRRGPPSLAAAAMRERLIPEAPSGPRLELAGAGEARVIRLVVAEARSVEIMADFTDWTPVALRRASPDTWELELALPSGVQRLNVRIDGGAWTVPRGVRLEQTEFGGKVGILVLP